MPVSPLNTCQNLYIQIKTLEFWSKVRQTQHQWSATACHTSRHQSSNFSCSVNALNTISNSMQTKTGGVINQGNLIFSHAPLVYILWSATSQQDGTMDISEKGCSRSRTFSLFDAWTKNVCLWTQIFRLLGPLLWNLNSPGQKLRNVDIVVG